MTLPKMTGLQFLVVSLLLDGRQSGRELRAKLAEREIEISQSAFSQLMQRLAWSCFVHCRFVQFARAQRAVRECLYEATVSGLRAWREAREFYLSFPPPSAELELRLYDDEADARDADRLQAALKRRLKSWRA